MIVERADGTHWRIEKAVEKLRVRAGLPGARVFDSATEALRKARAAGVPPMDCLALALPASWCVNSPAPSPVLRRWALPPQSEVWMALLEVLEKPRSGPLDPESREALDIGLRALGAEPFLVEAVSKVLALLVPDAVPLMPPAARAFALGAGAPDDARAFLAMVDWFERAVREGAGALGTWAAAHAEVPISAAQALNRLLWFDSEGFRHFPELGSSAVG